MLISNGSDVSIEDFEVTGVWASWDTTSVTVDLEAGFKLLRLEANQGAGLANIDSIEITGPGVATANCDGTTTANEEELAQYLKDGVKNHLQHRGQIGSSSTSSSASSASSAASSSGGAAPTGGDSNAKQVDDITNTQEEGVDEADIIEFDGTNLFVVRGYTGARYFIGNNSSSSSTSSASSSTSTSASSTGGTYISEKGRMTITSYAADKVNGSVDKLSELSLPYDQHSVQLSGAYLRATPQGNRLTTIASTGGYVASGWNYYPGYYAYYQVANTVSIVTTDIDDPNAMAEVEKLRFDGALVSSRRVGKQLYVVSRYSPSLQRLGFTLSNSSTTENLARLEALSIEELLPQVYDENGASKPLLSASDCTLPEWPEAVDAFAGSMVVLTKINLDDTKDMQSTCLPASASDIYASQDAIYTFGYGYSRGMKIHKFGINEALDYRGSIRVDGHVPCREKPYCFGEKEGVLHVLYSAYDSTIAGGEKPDAEPITTDTRYRLALIGESSKGKKLELVSTLPNASRPESIGKPGELVYGTRSFGDYVYIVTFDKVDPLYAINLSDSEDPFIAGALEVEGFSQYLHPVGENLLIGIGKDAVFDPTYIAWGRQGITWYQGIKVELFDISDPTNLKSLGSEIIGKRGSQSTVLSDPRAFAFKNDDYGMRFSLPVQVNDILPVNGDPDKLNQSYNWNHSGLYVFGIEDNAQGEAQLSRKGVLKASSYQSVHNNDRGVLMDEAVFFLHNYTMYGTLLDELEVE